MIKQTLGDACGIWVVDFLVALGGANLESSSIGIQAGEFRFWAYPRPAVFPKRDGNMQPSVSVYIETLQYGKLLG